jgi:hypothetical protein
MINWLPGFVFEDTRQARGLDGSTGNVLIDGKPPTAKTDTLQNVLKRIPPNQVERIDIIVGGAPGIDMRGRGVIANIVLKSSAKAKKAITASTYVDRYGRAAPELLMTLSRKYAGRTLDASLDYGRNYGIGTALGYGVTTRRDGTGAILFSADTRFLVGGPYVIGTGGYEFPAAHGVLKITATGRYYGGRLDQTDELRTGPDVYRFTERNTYRQGELGLRYERAFGRTTLETQVLERLTERRLYDNTERPPRPFSFTEADNETESVLRTVLRFKRDARLTLEGSAEGALNTVDTASAQVANGVPQPLPAPNVGVREQRGDAGVKLTWKPNDRYSLDAALKAEASVLNASGDVTLERRFAYLKPRAVFAWSPDKQTQLRLRAEHEVGQVEFNNFVTTSEFFSGQFRAGNPNIRPQRAYVAEAVFERRFWLTGSLSLTLRQQALRDVVDVAPVFSPTGVYGVVTNIGDGKESDLIANVTLPLKRLGLNDTLVRAVVTRAWRSVDDPVDGGRGPCPTGSPSWPNCT